jgi:hypothetical protein
MLGDKKLKTQAQQPVYFSMLPLLYVYLFLCHPCLILFLTALSRTACILGEDTSEWGARSRSLLDQQPRVSTSWRITSVLACPGELLTTCIREVSTSYWCLLLHAFYVSPAHQDFQRYSWGLPLPGSTPGCFAFPTVARDGVSQHGQGHYPRLSSFCVHSALNSLR